MNKFDEEIAGNETRVFREVFCVLNDVCGDAVILKERNNSFRIVHTCPCLYVPV